MHTGWKPKKYRFSSDALPTCHADLDGCRACPIGPTWAGALPSWCGSSLQRGAPRAQQSVEVERRHRTCICAHCIRIGRRRIGVASCRLCIVRTCLYEVVRKTVLRRKFCVQRGPVDEHLTAPPPLGLGLENVVWLVRKDGGPPPGDVALRNGAAGAVAAPLQVFQQTDRVGRDSVVVSHAGCAFRSSSI